MEYSQKNKILNIINFFRADFKEDDTNVIIYLP